jgi:alcohol dehydrogenase class IV
MANFIVPQEIITGLGCLSELPKVVGRLSVTRATLVVGRSWAQESGYAQKIVDMLKEIDVRTHIFSGVPAEPGCQIIDELRQAIRMHNSEVVIGMGGGSVMDAAKAGSILINSKEPTAHHLQSQKLPEYALPVIAIATTAGTGSEATPTVVLTDEATRVKQSFRSFNIMPAAAIVDPELMVMNSQKITAMSGMDAFVQAVEAFCSKFATNLSDALTEKAISLIAQNLTKAWHDGSNLSARQAMGEGSLMAGMALANVRLGAVHGLAHPIGGKYDIPHGLTCAILLPVVLEFNKSALYSDSEDKYSRLCNILMADPVNFSRQLLKEMNLPKNFREYKIPHDAVRSLAEQSLNSGSTKANPRNCSLEDMMQMIEQVI